MVILPVVAEAMILEQKYGTCMFAEAQGIYRLGDTEPSILPGEIYYTRNTGANTQGRQNRTLLDTGNSSFSISVRQNNLLGSLQEITDFMSETSHVYDKFGKLVIADYMMRNKERYLGNLPSLPSRSIVIIEMIIRDLVGRTTEYGSKATYQQEIYNLLLPEYHFIQDQNLLEDTIPSVVQRVLNFIGEDTWHIYQIRRNNGNVVLEKTIDYRIYEYHRRLDDEYQDKINRANGDY
jgi:hypothetical protein